MEYFGGSNVVSKLLDHDQNQLFKKINCFKRLINFRLANLHQTEGMNLSQKRPSLLKNSFIGSEPAKYLVIHEITFILFKSSNNQISEFRIPNIYNEILFISFFAWSKVWPTVSSAFYNPLKTCLKKKCFTNK